MGAAVLVGKVTDGVDEFFSVGKVMQPVSQPLATMGPLAEGTGLGELEDIGERKWLKVCTCLV